MAKKNKKQPEGEVSPIGGSRDLPSDSQTLRWLLEDLTGFVALCVRLTEDGKFKQLHDVFADLQKHHPQYAVVQDAGERHVSHPTFDHPAGLLASPPFVDPETLFSSVADLTHALDEWLPYVNRKHVRKPLVIGTPEERKTRRAELEKQGAAAREMESHVRRNLVVASEALIALFTELHGKIVQALTGFDNDDTVYLPIGKLFPGAFETRRQAMAFIDEHSIRTTKPSPQRLNVHAGDWLRALILRDDVVFNQGVFDEGRRQIEERKSASRRKKIEEEQ